jgi:hypothetical protein
LLLIIFVFDPLAVTLVVVANQAFSKPKTNPEPDKATEEIVASQWEEQPPIEYTITSSSIANDFPYDDDYMSNIWYPPYDNVKPTVVTGSIVTPIVEETKPIEIPKTQPKRPAYWASK